MAGTTFEKYGGFKTVSRVVMTFYDLVLDNDDVGHHFDNIDMARLMDHQTKFVSGIMGGPAAISDERLQAAHRHIDVTNAEFDVIVALMGEALSEHGMDPQDIRDVARIMESKRSLIVDRT